MDTTGQRVNTTVNAFPNRDALFDTAAELYGINREVICGIIQLKTEISSNTELSEWMDVQLERTMKILHAMDVLKCKLHQFQPVVLLILTDGIDGVELLEKLKDLETMRYKLNETLSFWLIKYTCSRRR